MELSHLRGVGGVRLRSAHLECWEHLQSLGPPCFNASVAIPLLFYGGHFVRVLWVFLLESPGLGPPLVQGQSARARASMCGGRTRALEARTTGVCEDLLETLVA